MRSFVLTLNFSALQIIHQHHSNIISLVYGPIYYISTTYKYLFNQEIDLIETSRTLVLMQTETLLTQVTEVQSLPLRSHLRIEDKRSK